MLCYCVLYIPIKHSNTHRSPCIATIELDYGGEYYISVTGEILFNKKREIKIFNYTFLNLENISINEICDSQIKIKINKINKYNSFYCSKHNAFAEILAKMYLDLRYNIVNPFEDNNCDGSCLDFKCNKENSFIIDYNFDTKYKYNGYIKCWSSLYPDYSILHKFYVINNIIDFYESKTMDIINDCIYIETTIYINGIEYNNKFSSHVYDYDQNFVELYKKEGR